MRLATMRGRGGQRTVTLTETILNVNDEDVQRRAISHILRGAGFVVLEAADGAAALPMARRQPDLILLDVKLPDIDGFEVCRRLKADPTTATIPVIHLSAARRESADIVAGLEGGADGYLTWPIDRALLVSTIRAYLRARRAEEQLRYQANLLVNVSDAIIATDLQTRVLTWNPAAEALYGWKAEEIIGRPLHGAVQMDPTGVSPEEMRRAMTETGRWQGEMLQRRRDGSAFPVSATITQLRDAAGAVIGGLAIVHDITERKQAEEAERAGVESQRAILRTAMDGFWLVDMQGRLLEVNETYCRMSGYTEQELLGMYVWELDAADSTADVGARIQEIIARRESRFESLHRRKDGSIYAIESSVQYRPADGGRLVVFVRDISERKRAEEALRQSEDRLSSAFLTISDAFYISTVEEGVVLEVNPGFERIFGYQKDEVIGRKVSDLNIWSDYADRTRMVERLLAEGRVEHFETQGRKKGGETFFASLSTTLFQLNGRPHIVGVIRDITQRKRLEEQYLQAQKMEAIGRLAGGVAHDFNNILTAIIGNASLAKVTLAPETPGLNDIERILQSAKRAADLTKQLLAFSRSQVMDPTLLNLNDVVFDLTKMLRRLLGEDIELVVAPTQPLGLIRADRAQMQQVILNLAVNARNAMPAGGRLLMETANVMLDAADANRCGVANAGDFVLLRIADNGAGLSEETVAHLFEPFFDAHETGRGAGLDLAAVYGIVKQHGGAIQCQSAPGQGTRFEIFLPRAEDAKVAKSLGDAALALPRGSETILVVEDDATVRDIVVRALQAQGYRVLQADNGEEGVRVAGELAEPIDMLITDVVMPRMGGRRLAELIRLARPDIQVLFVSGYASDLPDLGEIPGRPAYFLSKPFTTDSLAYITRRICDAGRA